MGKKTVSVSRDSDADAASRLSVLDARPYAKGPSSWRNFDVSRDGTHVIGGDQVSLRHGSFA